MGGFSQSFLERGHYVIRIDNDSRFSKIPNTIIGDVRDLPLRVCHPDILLMSPPCNEFSRESMPWCKTGQNPSLDLVNYSLKVVSYLLPTFWVLENVRGAIPYLGRPKKRCGPYYLWGSFPIFDCEIKKRKSYISGFKRELRAKIPYNLSLALCKSIEIFLNSNKESENDNFQNRI